MTNDATNCSEPRRAIVVGAGPAGLMAAEALVQIGIAVDVFDAMPSAGRKFLLAGKGGLNLTHGEALDAFVGRYGSRRAALEPALRDFGPEALRAWAAGLGIATFVGTSGRVFPADLKAAPLLRAWLHRLRASGVRFHMRARWLGWDESGALRFATAEGDVSQRADAVVLALGGASWPQLGSDGAWAPLLAARGVSVAPLLPSNCGFDVGRTLAGPEGGGWSEFLRARFAGHPIKPVALVHAASGFARPGEFVLTETGIEGSLVYAASAAIRDAIAANGQAVVHLDLLPAHDAATVLREVARPRGARSLATHLKSRLSIGGAKAALLHELVATEQLRDPAAVARALKALPISLARSRPVAEAISSAGGVSFDALTPQFMLRGLPGVFCAGEMLDWEAPTGGYLLTACLATGRAAGRGAAAWIAGQRLSRRALDPGSIRDPT